MQEAVKLLFECPKLVSMDLRNNMTEIFTLFNLYHGIKEPEVMDVFRAFPYLFCCDLIKMRYFMGQFRKYKFDNETVLHLVSHIHANTNRARIQAGCWRARCLISLGSSTI